MNIQILSHKIFKRTGKIVVFSMNLIMNSTIFVYLFRANVNISTFLWQSFPILKRMLKTKLSMTIKQKNFSILYLSISIIDYLSDWTII